MKLLLCLFLAGCTLTNEQRQQLRYDGKIVLRTVTEAAVQGAVRGLAK